MTKLVQCKFSSTIKSDLNLLTKEGNALTVAESQDSNLQENIFMFTRPVVSQSKFSSLLLWLFNQLNMKFCCIIPSTLQQLIFLLLRYKDYQKHKNPETPESIYIKK